MNKQICQTCRTHIRFLSNVKHCNALGYGGIIGYTYTYIYIYIYTETHAPSERNRKGGNVREGQLKS